MTYRVGDLYKSRYSNLILEIIYVDEKNRRLSYRRLGEKEHHSMIFHSLSLFVLLTIEMKAELV